MEEICTSDGKNLKEAMIDALQTVPMLGGNSCRERAECTALIICESTDTGCVASNLAYNSSERRS